MKEKPRRCKALAKSRRNSKPSSSHEQWAHAQCQQAFSPVDRFATKLKRRQSTVCACMHFACCLQNSSLALLASTWHNVHREAAGVSDRPRALCSRQPDHASTSYTVTMRFVVCFSELAPLAGLLHAGMTTGMGPVIRYQVVHCDVPHKYVYNE